MRGSMRGSGRRGFTLVEVMVALTVSAIVLLTVRAMFEALTGTAMLVSDAARAQDGLRNSERELRGLVALAIAPRSTADRFDGSADAATFSTWCTAPEGWLRPCRVTLGIRGDSSGTALMFGALDRRSSVAFRRRGLMELRYLVPSEWRDSWVATWRSTSSPPLAIAIVSPTDTVLLRVGDRG